ncbi:putative methylglutaconyl-CoA hydratase, mitochondrial isoform X2 [Apostichopus japonicus]|uniref:Putative methylglutaconyl-CoA hydratase, mitochondrial isoform X2 n=1 Tax=Stichopus japonicus TaxID=307972 RepID=A0A2G8LRA8_STIJA|nr:putative methylglutaconyl-CoA hydratase, mitochondrial isoform X2 [Apostichopus japonicus]
MFSSESDDILQLRYLEGDDKGIAVIGMNRPKAMNSFSRQMAQKIEDVLEAVKYDKDVRVVILRSLAPGVFSAGADLKERAVMQEKEVAPFVAKGRRMMTDFQELPMPVIAALDGVAAGGGMELALACDFRVSADDARMGLTECRLGIIPGGGGTQRLARTVGPGKAKELIFTGRLILGQEAARIGLVNYSVPQNETKDAAYQRSLGLAREILPNGPIGVKMAKLAINKGSEVDLNSGLAFEGAYYAQTVPTKDRMEALIAFREKRKPVFKGE